jgi:hypothetical protein
MFFRFLAGATDIFLFLNGRTDTETQLTYSTDSGSTFQGKKRKELEADHSPLSNAEVRNVGITLRSKTYSKMRTRFVAITDIMF